MKQKTIKSQTTQILHPEQSFNLRPSRFSIFIANAKDFVLFAAVTLVLWFFAIAIVLLIWWLI